jgi:hypothetical protein
MIDRKGKNYKVVCPKCKSIRFLTYTQHWNISKGISSGNCHNCKEGINVSGLKKGHGWNKGLKGFNKGHKPYFMAYGKDNPSWKGGTTPEGLKIRNSKEYSIWRNGVFERDKFTCLFCGQIGGKLCVDHIKPFSLFPELRLDMNNGRTLCFNCHKETDTYLSKVYTYAV